MSKEIIELIGYAASILVAISLTMSGIVKLRIINLIGAIFFSVYGLIVHAYPVAAVNIFIVVVDIYYLYDIFKAKEFFSILEVSHDSDYLNYFLEFHKVEILKYMPIFDFTITEKNNVFFILRNSIPAGLIITSKNDEESLFIEIDFVIPGYRDLKIGKYVYNNIFDKKHVKKLYASAGAPKHDSYLQKMGFTLEQKDGKHVFCLDLHN